MANQRITFFFKSDKYGVGWTENWWRQETDTQTAANNSVTYATARAALLSDCAQITAIRACNVDHPRDSYFRSGGLPITGSFAEATNPIAGVWDCLLCRRDGPLANFLGHVFMHMVPALIFTGRTYTPPGSGAWASGMTALQTELNSGSWYLRKINPLGGYTYILQSFFIPQRRTEHRLGRPFDALHGRRLVA